MLLVPWRMYSYLPHIYSESGISLSPWVYKNGKIYSFSLRQSEAIKLHFDKGWTDCIDGELKCGVEIK